MLSVSDDTRFRSIFRGSCAASHETFCLTREPSRPDGVNGASASGPNTEEGREGSNGAAGEMDGSERSAAERGGTVT